MADRPPEQAQKSQQQRIQYQDQGQSDATGQQEVLSERLERGVQPVVDVVPQAAAGSERRSGELGCGLRPTFGEHSQGRNQQQPAERPRGPGQPTPAQHEPDQNDEPAGEEGEHGGAQRLPQFVGDLGAEGSETIVRKGPCGIDCADGIGWIVIEDAKG